MSARVRLAWAVVLLLIAALEFVASYRGAVVPLLFAAAVVAPVAVVRGLQAARLGVFVPALLAIVLGTGGAWLALHRAAPGTSLGGLGDALPRLLTTPRPAPAVAALLAPSLLLVVLVAALVTAAVCAGRPGEQGLPGMLAPVLGAAVLYVAAQLLAAGSADRHGVAAACLLVVAAFGWSARAGGPRAAGAPAGVLAVLAVVGLAVGATALPRATAYDARRHVTPPAVRLHQDSPLTQLAAWSVNPDLDVLQVRVDGAARLHLATLTTFTGYSWQVADRYRQLGLATPPDLAPGTRRVSTRAVVRVDRLAGVWLPAAGRTRSASLPDTLVDADTGTLARTEPARPGLTYTVRGSADAPTGPQLAAASVPSHPPARYLALPGAPGGFAQYARAAVRGASTPLEEAIALEHAVSTGRKIDPSSPSGSSYGRLQTFLFTPRGPAGAQAGDAEQFAAAFAVLAREVGLPTRLTVGFLLGAADGKRTVTLHGRDATVWPEVYFTGAGWVPFSPTPGVGGGDSGDAGVRQTVLNRLATKAEQLPPAVSGSRGPRPPAGSAPPSAHRRPAASPDRTGWWIAAAVVLVVVLVVAALAGGLLAARARRRRRHRRLGARGAWAEFEDLLLLLGRPADPAATAPDLARDFDATHPDGPVRAHALATAADRDAFSPGPPPGGLVGGGGAGDTAPQAWRDVRVLHRRAVQTLPRRRRWLVPVDPRPLLRDRRSGAGQAARQRVGPRP